MDAETRTPTLETLCQEAGRREGHLPTILLAEQALQATEDADGPVQRAAMAALLQREKAAKTDALSSSICPGQRILPWPLNALEAESRCASADLGSPCRARTKARRNSALAASYGRSCSWN